MTLGTEVGLCPGHIVLDGDPLPPKKGGTVPANFRPFCCGQTAGWIKIELGTEVGLSPDNIVLDGNLAPLTEKGAQLPTFRLMFIVAKRLDGSRCHFVQSLGLGLGNIVLDADPAPPLKGHRPPFSAHVCCGQTVAHLSYC